MRWDTGLVALLLVNLFTIGWTAIVETEEKSLLKMLLTNYSRDSRPVINASRTVNIEFSISLIHLTKIDAENQALHSHVWLEQAWKDERLYWNPNNFIGEVTALSISSDKIWLPDLVLYNSIGGDKANNKQENARVNNDGRVIWTQSLNLQSSCDLDIVYFPFDKQTCFLRFSSWSYHGFQVNFTLPKYGAAYIHGYFSNSEWNLTEFKAKRNEIRYQCCPEVYIDIDVQISVQRMPLYYIYSIIIPCMWLTVLNLLVFLLPLDTGDRVSLGVTIFLAFSVFMLVLAEKVPATSQSVPLIGSYLTVVMGMTSLSLIMTIFILNLHHAGPHRKGVPRWLQILSHDVLSRILCLKPTAIPFQHYNAKCATNDHEDEIVYDRETEDSVTTLLNIWVEKQMAEERQQKVVEEWRFVASVFDRMLFWLFLIGNVIYMALFMSTLVRI